MDCKCGCYARITPVADTCVYAEGLELTNTEWCSMLGCLVIPNRGFGHHFFIASHPQTCRKVGCVFSLTIFDII